MSRGPESQPQRPSPSKLVRPEVDLPRLPRKYALVYLLERLELLNRDEIRAIAAELHADGARADGERRSLAKICEAALAGRRDGLLKDPFLNHVVLKYEKTEMDKELSTESIKEGEAPRSPVDAIAGGGPERPLVKELYSLESIGEVFIGSDQYGREVFVPTYGGSVFADALGVVVHHIKWSPNVRVVIDRYGSRTIHQPPQSPDSSG